MGNARGTREDPRYTRQIWNFDSPRNGKTKTPHTEELQTEAIYSSLKTALLTEDVSAAKTVIQTSRDPIKPLERLFDDTDRSLVVAAVTLIGSFAPGDSDHKKIPYGSLIDKLVPIVPSLDDASLAIVIKFARDGIDAFLVTTPKLVGALDLEISGYFQILGASVGRGVIRLDDLQKMSRTIDVASATTKTLRSAQNTYHACKVSSDTESFFKKVEEERRRAISERLASSSPRPNMYARPVDTVELETLLEHFKPENTQRAVELVREIGHRAEEETEEEKLLSRIARDPNLGEVRTKAMESLISMKNASMIRFRVRELLRSLNGGSCDDAELEIKTLAQILITKLSYAIEDDNSHLLVVVAKEKRLIVASTIVRDALFEKGISCGPDHDLAAVKNLTSKISDTSMLDSMNQIRGNGNAFSGSRRLEDMIRNHSSRVEALMALRLLTIELCVSKPPNPTALYQVAHLYRTFQYGNMYNEADLHALLRLYRLPNPSLDLDIPGIARSAMHQVTMRECRILEKLGYTFSFW